MKKVFVSICIAGAALAMSSCRSVEKAISLSSINGEWNIIEVNGSKITPGESKSLPLSLLIQQPVVCPAIAAVIG